MNKNTLLWLAGLGAAYYFLSNRQALFTQQPDGSYQPTTIVDRLTMMVTGQVAPATVPPSKASIQLPGFSLQVN